MKPYNTLRAMLVSPKDKTEKLNKSGVVYHVKCADCPASYVGETARSLGTRLTWHKRPNSAVAEHSTNTVIPSTGIV